MVLTIEVSEEVERSLAARAEREGTSVEAVSAGILAQSVSRESVPPEFRGMSGPEIVAFWQREGVIGSRPEIEDSAAYARELREAAQHRRDRD